MRNDIKIREDKVKIGIIGIEIREAVALNLLNLGFDVSVYNRTKEKAVEVEKNGATVMNYQKQWQTIRN